KTVNFVGGFFKYQHPWLSTFNPPQKKLHPAQKKPPKRDRLQIVEELLASLETAADGDVDAAWAAEIERRSREIKHGVVRPVPWGVVKAQARKRVRGGR
ncbi:MAG: addiction module protein, partial [Candidatus Binatia bacterium]